MKQSEFDKLSNDPDARFQIFVVPHDPLEPIKTYKHVSKTKTGFDILARPGSHLVAKSHFPLSSVFISPGLAIDAFRESAEKELARIEKKIQMLKKTAKVIRESPIEVKDCTAATPAQNFNK
jgi:hypothetical protein